jgi:hypothetical protein
MTTSPRRIRLFEPVIESLFNQSQSADAYYLNLPARFRNAEDYDIPDWLSHHPKLRITRSTEPDWGPAMKLLPVLPLEPEPDTNILTIDDDVIFPLTALSTFVEASIASPDTAFCSMGFCFETGTGNIKPIRENLSPCDALQGFSGCVYRRSHFDESSLKTSIGDLPEEFRINDDIIFSNHVAGRGIARATIQFPSGKLEFTDWSDNDPDALKSVGPGTHARYQEMRRYLQAQNQWHLS